tara:strand:- start:721 stop:1689 length:969 start_codon:yes stop_codon:yes gene_type:complete
MSFNFSNIISNIKDTEFSYKPFKHLYIKNLFSEEEFKKIIETPEINLKEAKCDEELFENLFENGYKIIKFPGCIADKDYYLQWHNKDTRVNKKIINNEACESFGMTLRLISPKTKILYDLNEFIKSDSFLSVLAEKFEINLSDCEADNGIQKYLDGYEISPHPDIRRKALTYMVNINSTLNSNKLDHHTRYLSLKNNYSYLYEFWKNNDDIERAWIPWEWCEIEFQQNLNNTMVVFSPSSDTLHAVKANYDHLKGQRTQLYGNLWYSNSIKYKQSQWADIDLVGEKTGSRSEAEKRDENFRLLQRGKNNDKNVHIVNTNLKI